MEEGVVAMSGTTRNWLVCVEKGCSCVARANSSVELPEQCSYKILHLMDTKRGGIQERDRQTGKTTELMKIAEELSVSTGKSV